MPADASTPEVGIGPFYRTGFATGQRRRDEHREVHKLGLAQPLDQNRFPRSGGTGDIHFWLEAKALSQRDIHVEVPWIDERLRRRFRLIHRPAHRRYSRMRPSIVLVKVSRRDARDHGFMLFLWARSFSNLVTSRFKRMRDWVL